MSNVKGLDQVMSNFNKLYANLEGVTTKAVEDVALDICAKAQQHAPIDTGDLRGSASVTVNGVTVAQGAKTAEGQPPRLETVGVAPKSAKPVAVVGFDVPYAEKQHEDLELHHDEGMAKYLEAPFRENQDRYLEHMAKSIKDKVR